jgi:YHS domain-containing protein
MFGFRSTPDRPSFPRAPATSARWRQRPVIRCLAAVVLLSGGILMPPASHAAAAAAVAWHPSLKQALTAAASHQRPVLVVFTAEWSPAAAQLKKHVLTDPNAAALLSACFEPVLIDVDANPEVTSELGMKHIPGGCLVRADGTVISRFECPTATGQFIATVARHLQQTDGGATAAAPAANLAGAVTVVAERVEVASDFSTAGSLLADAAATGPTSKSGAVSQIAAKVRGLSQFADAPAPVARAPFRSPAPTLEQAPLPSAYASRGPAPAPQAPATPAAAAFPEEGDEADLLASTPPFPTATRSPQPVIPPPATAAIVASTQSPQPTTPAATAISTASPAITREPAMASSTTPSQAAPWAAEPARFAAASTDQHAEAAAATAPASSRMIAAVPPQLASDDATTGDLIEPQPTAPEQARAPSPWLAPAATAVAAAAPLGTSTPAAAPNAAPAPAPAPATAQPPRPAAPQMAAATTTTQPVEPEAAPAATTPNPVLAALQKPFSMFTGRANEPEQKQPTTPALGQTSQPATETVANYASQTSAEEPATPETMPLGLEGYCPVSLVETGGWVEGQAQWGARHRGRTYLFSGLEEQQAFLADPDRYAPALSGDDPVVAFDSGSTVSGQRQYGVTYQQRIYLFASPESRATFAANPQRYTSRVMLAEQPTSTGGTILR